MGHVKRAFENPGELYVEIVRRMPGLSRFLGFFYQRFGSSKTGNAFLQACKARLEEQND